MSEYPHGATFFEKDDKLMFVCVNDTTNVVGPREATDADKTGFPSAWKQFEATKPKKAKKKVAKKK